MNSAKIRSALVALGSLCAALPVLGHPGHDLRDATPGHLLTSPDHLLALALGGATLWLAAHLVRRPLPRRILQGVGLLALLGAAVLGTLRA